MNDTILKNVLIILGLLTVAFAGYYMYTQKGATVLGAGEAPDVAYQDMLSRTQVFIQRRKDLEKTQLDIRLLEDERFRSLQHFSQPIKDIGTGRTDPFAAVNASTQ